MALWIRRTVIDRDLSQKLQQDLTILPPLDKGPYPKAKEPFKLYKINKETLAIPLHYGLDLLGKDPSLSHRKSHHPIKIERSPGLELYPHQEVVFAEVQSHLTTYGTVNVVCYTSFGKSVLLCCTMVKCGYLGLILVTQTLFAEQLATALRNNTTGRVWLVPDGKPRKKEQIPLPGEVLGTPSLGEVDVIVTTPGRFHKIPEELINAVGTLLIDEADVACVASCVEPIMSVRPRYLITCTATFTRTDNKHRMLELLAGTHRVERTMDIPVTVIKWDTQIKVEIDKESVWTSHIHSLARNPIRNQMIVDFVIETIQKNDKEESQPLSALTKGRVANKAALDVLGRFSDQKRPKIVIMTWLVEDHAIPLVDLLRANGVSADYLSGKKKKYGDVDVLVGSFMKVGRGLDEAMACAGFDGSRIGMVLWAMTTIDETQTTQSIGRACRSSSPLFVPMIDSGSIPTKHWRILKGYCDARPNFKILQMTNKPRQKREKKVEKPKEVAQDLMEILKQAKTEA